MTRSIRAVFALAVVVLVVPTAAFAASHAARRAHLVPAGRAVTIPLDATVSSYSAGTLTLSLDNGGTLVGSVTAATRFICPRAFTPGRVRGSAPPCDTTALVAPEGVAGAEMSLTATGLVFRDLILVAPAPPTNNPV